MKIEDYASLKKKDEDEWDSEKWERWSL